MLSSLPLPLADKGADPFTSNTQEIKPALHLCSTAERTPLTRTQVNQLREHERRPRPTLHVPYGSMEW